MNVIRPTALPTPSATDGRCERAALIRLLIAAAAVEVLILLLVLWRPGDILGFVWTPDSSSYVDPASHMASTLRLPRTPRTLGYPLVLAAAELLTGSPENSWRLVVAVQLAVNLLLTWGCWRVLQRLAGSTALGLRVAGTLLFFWAGLGMATFVMTDHLAAACFFVFLYGVLFWRRGGAVALAACALAFATLIRPAFTLMPLAVPVLAYAAGRMTARLRPAHLAMLLVIPLGATGLSVAYQYAVNGYLGPSPMGVNPVREIIYYGIEDGEPTEEGYAAFKERFERRVAELAHRPYDDLSYAEREEYAKTIFRQEFRAHPGAVIASIGTSFVKLVFAPIESIVVRVFDQSGAGALYATYVRPLLTAVFVPVWLLGLVPPLGAPRQHQLYYVIVITCLCAIVGPAAITVGAGERIRFPLLAFLLPLMAYQAQVVLGHARASITAWRERTVAA